MTKHVHRWIDENQPRPDTRLYHGACDCGTTRRYPLEPVIPGRAASTTKGAGRVFRLAFGVESGVRGGEATSAGTAALRFRSRRSGER